MVPGCERLPVVGVDHVRLALFETRQAGPVPTSLHAEPTRNARPKSLRPGEFPNEVHLAVV